MTRRQRTALLSLACLAVLVSSLLVWIAARRADRRERTTPESGAGVNADAVARLRAIPFYRGLIRGEVLRSATIEGDVLHLDVDLTALLRPRLTPSGLGELVDLLPRSARGTLRLGGGFGSGIVSGESWILDGPAPLLAVLDRRLQPTGASPVWDAVPATPNAIAGARVLASHLAEPEFGGPAMATWRRRVEIAEHVLGRPLRAEIAEDIAGPIVFALYDATSGSEADGLLVIELKRSDRLSALLDTVFALGALTEQATVRRYRDVATGSFSVGIRGPGVALAVDGPLLLAASSRHLLEGAIDARRGDRRAGAAIEPLRARDACWSAVAASAFVAHGWARIARVEEQPAAAGAAAAHDATLVPEGASSWRLEGRGRAPAITTDPVIPFLRFVFGGRQRGAG